MKKYLTTPIYYVNDVPHIGHAYTTIAADVLARFYKSQGIDTFFLTGTDEHGAKIFEAAKKSGKEPKIFVDELSEKFKKTWENLNIDYSEFFRTTNPNHEKQAQEFVKKLVDAGLVEKRKYEGLYCVSCERYYKEEELVNGKCPDHNIECKKQSEENYFFLLSKFQAKLASAIEKGELEIGPTARKNEILAKIKLGLEDVSISRANVAWGVKFPEDESQTIYVWVDALLNYYTATKIYGEKSPIWPADLHLMAKDILWFHAVIWPAMLLALDLPLPKKVFAHGFFTINNQKMSKTIGNVIDPNEMVEKFGADAVRYALLREFPFGEDGDISVEKIQAQYENLANNIGNLLQRVLVMIKKNHIQIRNPKSEIRNSKISKLIEELKFNEALKEIDNLAVDTNKYIAENEPWKLEGEKLNEVLAKAYENLIIIAELISPFMPDTAEKMKKQLETLEPEPLFPKII